MTTLQQEQLECIRQVICNCDKCKLVNKGTCQTGESQTTQARSRDCD